MLTKHDIDHLLSYELRIEAAKLAGFIGVRLETPLMSSVPDSTKEDFFGTRNGQRQCIPDYPNNIAAAMELWARMPLPKEIWWGNDHVIGLAWDFQQHRGYADRIVGKIGQLACLITQAFIITNQKED